MNKVISLRIALRTLLGAVHSRVFYEIAPEDAEYPLGSFLLSNSYDDGTMENFVLEVDGWDSPEDGDTTALETLMDAFDKAIHKQVIRTNGMAFIIYRENRLPLDDPDKRLRGRRIIYQVRTFGGG
ncbi:hypothetical protein [Paenibacillus sp. DMB5]|uniref:hypothetical protein n=1 Tax=Paenibacillus sp. DMB5 TaxID=1780103 RepID=UPI00076DA8FC|nr:hypothetical protein [Paenibacillus sp. DMB5]KUP24918.1 hypothetical protein AWJ19_03270 [Paenibacillus sp. DMB5]